MSANTDGHPGTSGTEPQPLYALIAAYDVTTARPHRDTAQLFRDMAASAHAEQERLRAANSAKELELAAAKAQVQALHRQVSTLRRVQFLGAATSLLGAVLVGFGVNYLTAGQSTPGWLMLGLGALLQVSALFVTFIVREDNTS